MKNIIALSLSAGFVLGAVGLAARGTEPPGQRTVSASQAPQKGRVAILDNENTVTGDIERVGGQYRIKYLIGETWLPASRVVHLCASMEQAYEYLRDRANLNDPDERLRLIDWCRQHGLRTHAVNEAREAVKLRPQDTRLRRLLAHLEETKTYKAPAARPAPPPRAALKMEVTSESMGMFATKVHPILMNACASCHTAPRGGGFQLLRIAGPALSSRRSLEQNLNAVLEHVNTRDPMTSRLLTKAVSIHAFGMAAAPLKGRQAVAYRTLEQWVRELVENNPQLRSEETASADPKLPPQQMKAEAEWGTSRLEASRPEAKRPETSRPEPSPGTPRPDNPAAAATPAVPPVPVAPVPSRPVPVSQETPLKPAAPQLPRSDDPVDPEGFNREFHPMGKMPEG